MPSNVAEGHAYGTVARCIYHLRVAIGSLGELDTQFEIAKRLNYMRDGDLAEFVPQLVRTRQLLYGLLRAKCFQLAKSAGKSVLLAGPAIGFLLLAVLR